MEWDTERNGALTPRDVTPSSNKRVWWLCPMGHAYRATVKARTEHKAACPICSGKQVLPGFNDLETLHPEIAQEWHQTLNEGLTPDMVTAESKKKVWWQCAEGHVWQQNVYDRTVGDGWCPVCSGAVDPERDWRYRRMVEVSKRKLAAAERAEDERYAEGESNAVRLVSGSRPDVAGQVASDGEREPDAG